MNAPIVEPDCLRYLTRTRSESDHRERSGKCAEAPSEHTWAGRDDKLYADVKEGSLEVLRASSRLQQYMLVTSCDGEAVDLFANKPRILGDEVWNADSS